MMKYDVVTSKVQFNVRYCNKISQYNVTYCKLIHMYVYVYFVVYLYV